jgi:transcriptional regulator with XRE-family HTH domain
MKQIIIEDLDLKRLRKAKGLSQRDFATELGISQAYLSRIENRHVSPGVNLIEDICGRLDCELCVIKK